MFISKDKRGQRVNYGVFFTAAEADSTTAKPIGWFDTMDEAAVVYRFLNGGSLTDEQLEVYCEAMKKFDVMKKPGADTHQSTDTQ